MEVEFGLVGWGIGWCWSADPFSGQTQLSRVKMERTHVEIYVILEEEKWKKPLPGHICGWHFQITHKIA